jgi:aryl-alcohol dehydrogenase-like predicted oxidoreductase
MDALHIFVEQGKVLYLAISDTPAWIVSACNEYAVSHGKTPFSVYQGRWNIMLREMERDIVPMARHYGMAICPWDVLGGGKFQSKKALEEREKSGDGMRNLGGDRKQGQTDMEAKISQALAKVASEHGIESVTAVALAWIMAKAPYVFPIIGGRKVEHLKDNIQALKLQLTKKQMEYLESVKPLVPEFPHNFVGEDPHVSGTTTGLMNGVAKFSFVESERSLNYSRD